MKKIIEASELPDGEKVYLKRDFFGWRTVEPWKNDDGSINWFNLLTGGKKNIAILIFLMILAGLFYFGVNELLQDYKVVVKTPCDFCKNCQEQTRNVLKNINSKYLEGLNISNINLSLGGDNG